MGRGLGWQVEAQDEAFIRRMVDEGHATEEQTRHRGALVWRAGAAITSPDPGRPRVLFQEVPEAEDGQEPAAPRRPDRAGATGGGGGQAAGAGRDGALAGLAGPVLVGHPRRPGGQRVLRQPDAPRPLAAAAGGASAGLQVPARPGRRRRARPRRDPRGRRGGRGSARPRPAGRRRARWPAPRAAAARPAAAVRPRSWSPLSREAPGRAAPWGHGALLSAARTSSDHLMPMCHE